LIRVGGGEDMRCGDTWKVEEGSVEEESGANLEDVRLQLFVDKLE